VKLAFIDIGELGWSMYLAAHIRWQKKNTDNKIAVMTYPDRRCLYEDLADMVMEVPAAFYNKFDIKRQNCLGIKEVAPNILKDFLFPYLADDYHMPDDFVLSCKNSFKGHFDFVPYKYSKKLVGKEEVLIFPRQRHGGWYKNRNLKESFYIELIKQLCDEFLDLNIRTIGTTLGAYNIILDKPNYINYVGKGDGLQDMIDRCQLAVAAVGGQSAPPKISLLQGVPTFIIGHEKERHVNKENWMNTKTGFYEIVASSYDKADTTGCIAKIISFIKEIR